MYFFMKYYMSIYKYAVWIPFLLINLFYPLSHWINITVGGCRFTFILLGYYLKEFFKSDLNKRWYMILISLVITYMVSNFNGQIDLWGSTICNPFLCVLGGLAGSYAVIGITKASKHQNFLFLSVRKYNDCYGYAYATYILYLAFAIKECFCCVPKFDN